jgi:hypothetical protein
MVRFHYETYNTCLETPPSVLQTEMVYGAIFVDRQTNMSKNIKDRLNILSTYLPLFPPIRNELMSELMDIQKSGNNL